MRDLSREFAAAGVKAPWLAEIAANAFREEKRLHIADLPRLTELIGADLRPFVLDVMALAAGTAHLHQPLALAADDTRLLLARYLQRHDEFELLAEHAAYCHARQGLGAPSRSVGHGCARPRRGEAALGAKV